MQFYLELGRPVQKAKAVGPTPSNPKEGFRDWAEGALWGPVHPSYIWRQMARCPHCFLLVPVIILDSPGPSLLMLQGLSSKFLDHVSSGCVHAAVFALAA